jgi:hypothetical protein
VVLLRTVIPPRRRVAAVVTVIAMALTSVASSLLPRAADAGEGDRLYARASSGPDITPPAPRSSGRHEGAVVQRSNAGPLRPTGAVAVAHAVSAGAGSALWPAPLVLRI